MINDLVMNYYNEDLLIVIFFFLETCGVIHIICWRLRTMQICGLARTNNMV